MAIKIFENAVKSVIDSMNRKEDLLMLLSALKHRKLQHFTVKLR